MYGFPCWYERGKKVVFLDDSLVDWKSEWNIPIEKQIELEAILKRIPLKHRAKYKAKEGFPCHPKIAQAIRDGKLDRIQKALRIKVTVSEDGILLSEEGWYKNGKRCYKIHYSETGQLITEDIWYEDGKQIFYKERCSKTGAPIYKAWWYGNGQKNIEERFSKTGVLLSTNKWYRDGGKQLEIRYSKMGELLYRYEWGKQGEKILSE